ncbi:T9SS type A sorting domain-containing protein [Roseivirga pacifica]|uniref:T9SS type A sorting domain-containing protein n=1 Tax=Roseivirga pacifica TaxID=1267423 RepID=UPI0020951412|nr:T9SS type A sorting domain-containing protein [Roseivirga pacifica]MCO6357845.1 T9SS type A sorting domain-containing protein [Roseivirga pacifica]MCO6366097.1 T9SS type A sorting domain-containing protein [Roseivirga pacifica]MCO6371425.1 T9SS type A sorting domain-containing protein [Roseivirga pacifica]MCO6375403.1 T9SS type A sorting domain-containing protein [Roseivirga pacifica]MCO6378803.1 T9SS type A sorting domain-containing protein [Roseivirga pacifica]
MKRFCLNIPLQRFALVAILLLVCASLSAQNGRLAEAGGSSSDEKVKIEVFPNPTSDLINIDLTDAELSKPKIEIRSIIGTKMNIYLEKNGTDKYKVDVSSFPRGYYLVLVREDRTKFQQTIRFSKK